MARGACLKSLLVLWLAFRGKAYQVLEPEDIGRDVHLMTPDVQAFEEDYYGRETPLMMGENPSKECALPSNVTEEIVSYQKVVDSIIDYVTAGPYKGHVYRNLEELVDTFGYRMTGTRNLETAIDWMVEKSQWENLENVHTENVLVPLWARKTESAWMTTPRQKQLSILGLGGSISTPPEGIIAEVMVVKSFNDLQKNGDKAAGKIVVFNQPWVNYSASVRYRTQGASYAGMFGAVAALVRSITPLSISSPHTGQQLYTVKQKIPVASITVQDAEMMERMQARGIKITVKLIMNAQSFWNFTSRNTMAELTGTQLPNEKVLVSGHLDSWDVGQGAMDDGGGVMISWGSLVVLKNLGLRPRRTLQAVLWTAEEQGLYGSKAYFRKHKHDHKQFQLIMESDSGTFTPQGISFTGTPEATCIMKEVLKLLHRINATLVTNPMMGGPDIEVWEQLGVPTGGLINDNGRYFWFHHTEGDTLSVEDPDVLDLCLALWTSVAFIMADMKTRLPHSPVVNPDQAIPWTLEQYLFEHTPGAETVNDP